MGGQFSMIIVDRTIVTIGRKYRSKWWRVSCACSKHKRRKDGSCKHEQAVMEMLRPEIRERARIG